MQRSRATTEPDWKDSKMLNRRFSHFDPVDGILSARLGTRLFEPLYLARQLLGDRTSEEIRAIAQMLDENRLTAKLPAMRPTESGIPPMRVPLETGEIVEAWPALDEITLLQANIASQDLSPPGKPTTLKPHELYAVLALTFIDQACLEEQRFADNSAPGWARPTEDVLTQHIEFYALQASRATAAATGLHTAQLAQRAEKSKAGQARHKGTKPLKTAVQALYAEKYQHRSKRDAAKRIYDELSRNGSLTTVESRVSFQGEIALHNADPAHQFEKWLKPTA